MDERNALLNPESPAAVVQVCEHASPSSSSSGCSARSWLGDERGIRAEGSGDGREDALERAVARALLLDDRLQLHRSEWRKADAA